MLARALAATLLAAPASGQIVAVPSSFGGLTPAAQAGGSMGVAVPAPWPGLPAVSPGLGLSLPRPLGLAPSLPAASLLAPAVRPAFTAAVQVSRAPSVARGSGGPDAGRRRTSGTVRVFRGFLSRILGNERDVAVYLPPGYDGSSERYPVLYAHDGQNLFDPETAFLGRDWGLGATLDRLISSGEMAPVIVVAPYNSGARVDEYTPVPDPEEGGGRADDYGRFLVSELKPFIDASLRTRPGAEDTALLGSSLGGLVSLHLALSRPDAFSKAGVLSPSLWWAREAMTRGLASGPVPTRRPRLWVDMGTREGRGLEQERNVERLKALEAALLARGWAPGTDLEAPVVEGAGHDEKAWGERVARVLRFLFPPR